MLEDRSAKYRETLDLLKNAGMVSKHCHKHYYITADNFNAFGKEDQNEILQAIIYFYGSKSYWWNPKNGVEFYDNTSVMPAGKRPWHWCGETVLFEDWKNREENIQILKSTFTLGDKVFFINQDGEKVSGIFAGARKRATVIIPGGKWYIPLDQLFKEE